MADEKVEGRSKECPFYTSVSQSRHQCSFVDVIMGSIYSLLPLTQMLMPLCCQASFAQHLLLTHDFLYLPTCSP